MASCSSECKKLSRSRPSGKMMTPATQERARDSGEASSSSSAGSSCSSASLELRVVREADQDNLLSKVRALQQEAVALAAGIAGGRAEAGHVEDTLGKMLREQSILASRVSSTAPALEDVNRRTSGRAASHIASCRASLAAELRLLAKHISSLEEALRSGCGLLWPCSPINTYNDRGLPVTESGSSLTKSGENGSSPRLPDIYLTPSRPVPSSSPSSSPSSLSNLDPFTPDTISAPPTRDHSGVPGAYSGVSNTLTPLGRPTNESVSSPQLEVGGDCGRGSTSSVLQWLMSSSVHPNGGANEREEEEFDGNWGRGRDISSRVSEEMETAVVAGRGSASPLSPHISSPCADSGISSSNHSTHIPPSLPPSHPHHQFSPPPLTVTMSDIEAMKAELAKLREEIRNTSNWSPSLCQDYSKDPTAYLSLPLQTVSSVPQSHTVPAAAGMATIAGPPLKSTPLVSRPYQSVSGSHSRTPFPGSTSSHFPSHRRLFSPHLSLPRDTKIERRSQLVDHSVQTLPTSAPNSHSSTKFWTGTTESPFQHRYSSSPFISRQFSPSVSLTQSLPHDLPANFTPHLVVHTHHPPSHYSPAAGPSLSHLLPVHPHSLSPSLKSYQNTYHLSHWS